MSQKSIFRSLSLPAILFGLGLAMLSLSACQDQIKVSDNDLVQINYQQFNEIFNQAKPDEVVLVDVRSAQKYANGYIPGAINIFLPDLSAHEPRLAKAKQIIVYSGGWNDALSRAAGKRLLALGYSGVKDFLGGTDVWKTQGRMLAVIRETPTAEDQPQGSAGN